MKKLILILLVSVMTSTINAAAQADSIKKLKSFSAQQLEKKDKFEKNKELLATIDQTVERALAGKEKVSLDLITELSRASVLSFRNDPSESAAEIILPLYKKEKALFEKALKSLPKNEAQELKESLENVLREETSGNG